jgi:hypothetical protein
VNGERAAGIHRAFYGVIENMSGNEIDLIVRCEDGDETGRCHKRCVEAYTDNISLTAGKMTDMQGIFRHNQFSTFELFLFNHWQQRIRRFLCFISSCDFFIP